MDIYDKLYHIQQELKAPKSQYNSFGKYNYRKCEDILEAAKPLLAKYTCVLVISDTLEHIGDRYYIKATATLEDAGHDSDSALGGSMKIQVTAYAREEEKKSGMDGSQITGASSSYARKYALNGLFCIDDTADSDTTNVGPQKGASDARQNTQQALDRLHPQTPEERKKNQLSPNGYWNTVAAYAEGHKTDKGGDIRDWYISFINATPEEIARFDADVDNYRAARL